MDFRAFVCNIYPTSKHIYIDICIKLRGLIITDNILKLQVEFYNFYKKLIRCNFVFRWKFSRWLYDVIEFISGTDPTMKYCCKDF